MKKSSVLVALLLTAYPLRPALAALTPSEKAVVGTFIQKGVPGTAPRVRALVGRPDLTPPEVAEPLLQGYAGAPFDEQHRRFTEALLFGPGSAAARSSLVPGVVEALLARAQTRMADVPLEPLARVGKKEEAAVAELLEIHSFIDARIANAGSPPRDGHDPNAAIRDDALRASVGLYEKHLVAHERWFRAPGAVSQELARLRAQVGLTFIDLARGVVGRQEVSGPLGLSGARRGVFERHGVLIEAGGAPEARVEEAVTWLESAPRAVEELSLWVLGKTNTAGLMARGRIARTGAPLTAEPRRLPGAALWPEEVEPSSPDRGLAAVAASVAELCTGRALSPGSTLLPLSEAAAARAERVGAPGYLARDVVTMPLSGQGGIPPAAPAAPLVIAGAARLLLLDAPRALDLALIRAGEGHREPLEQLDLALTVLAGEGSRVTLGRTRDDGTVEPIVATELKREGALVSGFVLGGKRYTIAAGKDGFVGAVDGQLPKLTGLGGFRARPSAGDRWLAAGNVTFEKLHGEPRAAALDDGRFVLQGSKGGFDAVFASGDALLDMTVSATVKPTGPGGALLVRASDGDLSYAGVGLLLDADAKRGQLIVVDGRGKATELSPPVSLPPAPSAGYPVTLAIGADRVDATVGKLKLTGKLGRAVAEGHAGLAVKADGRLEVLRFKVQTRSGK